MQALHEISYTLHVQPISGLPYMLGAVCNTLLLTPQRSANGETRSICSGVG